MCRAHAEGGRRCPGHGQPAAREAHNRRRRENRAIQAGIIQWARECGAGSVVLRDLAEGGPAAAKAWARDAGRDPTTFLDSAPTGATHPRAGGVVDGETSRPASTGLHTAVEGQPWATPGIADQIAAVEKNQGSHPAEIMLLSSNVVQVSDASEGTNLTTRVELSNGIFGYHKAFSGLNDGVASDFGQDSAQQCLHEVAAWHLARELGGPWDQMVPPVVLRDVFGEIGSFALEHPGRTGSMRDFMASDTWRSAAFFDSLIGQQDRHGSNYLMYDEQISLIDHGYAFARPGDYDNMSVLTHYRYELDKYLSEDERKALNRLLASEDLFGADRCLTPDRAEALRDRAQRMLTTGRILEAGDF